VLGLPRSASAEQIKAAYRKEALKWHPDRHPEASREAASVRFKAISAAYQELSDDSARRDGDAARAAAGFDSQRGRARSEPFRGRGPERPSGFSQADAERLFREAFGGAASYADVLRAMEQAQRRGGLGAAAGAFEAALAAALRQSQGGTAYGRASTSTSSQVVQLPNGERVIRTTTVRVDADGSQHTTVSERSLGRASYGNEAYGSEQGAPGQAMPAGLAAAALGALSPLLARFGAVASGLLVRSLVSAMGVVLRTVLRRLFGR